MSYHNKPHQGCFGWPDAQGSVMAAFKTLAAQTYVLHKQRVSSSVCQAVLGATQVSTAMVYWECWKEMASWCAQGGVLNNTILPLN